MQRMEIPSLGNAFQVCTIGVTQRNQTNFGPNCSKLSGPMRFTFVPDIPGGMKTPRNEKFFKIVLIITILYNIKYILLSIQHIYYIYHYNYHYITITIFIII